MTVKTAIKCLPSLKALAKAKTNKQRKLILDHANKCIYSVIAEIARETLKGTFDLSEQRKNKLKPYKKHIRALARKSNPTTKKKIINQQGGFLPGLLVPAITLLANLAAR
uniref:Uncharacterized protein n=1 Tax=Tetranychus urticae TaxID=32264 RepID=A0A158P511_TETUR